MAEADEKKPLAPIEYRSMFGVRCVARLRARSYRAATAVCCVGVVRGREWFR